MSAPFFDAAALLLRALRRADMENSEFIGADEGAEYVEKAFQEFYLLLVGQFDNLCLKALPYPINITATSPGNPAGYGLPQDFLKLKMIELQDSSYRTLHRLRPLSSVVELVPFRVGDRSGTPTHYFLAGLPEPGPAPGTGNVQAFLFPRPDQVYVAQVWYIPNLSLADVGGDTDFPGLAHVAGWDEYVVITAAMKMKDKEESDCSVLMAERATLWDNMKRVLTPMDESEPGHVVMVGRAYGHTAFTADPYESESFG